MSEVEKKNEISRFGQSRPYFTTVLGIAQIEGGAGRKGEKIFGLLFRCPQQADEEPAGTVPTSLILPKDKGYTSKVIEVTPGA